MKILLTGGSGFLGSYLTELLTKQGDEIVNFDISNGDDIRNYENLENVCPSDIDAIIHIAAIANLNLYDLDKNIGYQININGTRNIIKLAEKLSVPIYFGSTCCCYGHNANGLNYEDKEIQPAEEYAESKKISEKDITDSRAKTGLKHVNMRFCTFFGSNKMRGALLAGIFIESIYKNKPINIYDDGLQKRCYGHVSQVARGICTIVHSNTDFDTINIAPSTPYSVWDVLTKIRIETLKYPEFPRTITLNMTDGRGSSDFNQDSVDNTRLKSLGWDEEMNFDEIVTDCVSSFVENGYKWIA